MSKTMAKVCLYAVELAFGLMVYVAGKVFGASSGISLFIAAMVELAVVVSMEYIINEVERINKRIHDLQRLQSMLDRDKINM